MAVKTLTPKLDHTSLREALDRIANRPDHLAWALAAVGFLYGDLAKQPPGYSPTEDTTGTPLNIRFGNLPYTTISDTSSHETRRATEETEITPDQVVKIVETHIEASEAKKLKDKNKMWNERRHEDNEIFEEIKELSAALGLKKPPCPRHRTSHRELVKVRTDLKEDLMQQKNAARAAAEKTAALKTAQQKKTAAQKAADNAAQAAAEKKPSPRGQADNHSVGPSNMITLNSVGQTSKSPPDNEDVGIATRRNASTNSGAENEQTTSQQIAAAEKTAAAERTTGSTEKEQNPSPKPTEDRDFENDEDSGELLIMLEGLLSAEGMKNPWMLDEVGFHGGLRIWYLRTWRDFMRFDEEHIIWAAESSPHLSNHLDDCGDAMVMPGDGSGSYGEIEYAEVDGDDVAQRWLPSSGDPRHTDLRDENKFDPYYRSEGEGYKVHNHSSLDDGGPITFELCDDAQPDEDERYAWSEECNDSDGAYGVGFTSL